MLQMDDRMLHHSNNFVMSVGWSVNPGFKQTYRVAQFTCERKQSRGQTECCEYQLWLSFFHQDVSEFQG